MSSSYTSKIDLQNSQNVLEETYFCPSYLDNFLNGQYKNPKVSVVIPTYNRSPHPVEEDSNPLAWCLESLLAQKNSGLDEMVIVDDASQDYTEEVVDHFSKNSKNISLSYIKNKKRRGMSISRNIGVEKSNNNLLMFVDDDCIFSKYILFGMKYTLDTLGEDAVVIHPPVYQRKTIPTLRSIKDIGSINLNEGKINSNFDSFPIEYIQKIQKEDTYIDNVLKILRPLEIKNIAGVFMIKKDALKKVNGFPENLIWENEYGTETELALQLCEKGYKIFFTPDPKFYSIHLKYGVNGNSKSREDIIVLDRIKLENLVEKSDFTMNNTGGRTNRIEDWFFNKILSSFFIIGKRNLNGARNLAQRFYENFVLNNDLVLSGIDNLKIDNYNKRLQIWKNAITEGEKLLNSLT